MTTSFPGTPGADGYAGQDLLAGYASGTVGPVVVWSVEAHLMGCARCRSALSEHADAGRLARNRTVLLVRAALPEGGRVRRLLCRCGVPDHLPRLLAATPSLRRSWLLSVLGALAVVAGEAAAVAHGWIGNGGHASPAGYLGPHTGPAGYLHPEALAPFLLVAPLLMLAGVAAAFLPAFDPASRLAAAAPLPGFTLLLARSVCALAAALVPVVAAAFLVGGPGRLPVALLVPSLALCAFALAAATVLGPRAAAVMAAALWVLSVLLLTAAQDLLVIVQRNAQFGCAAVLYACAVLVFVRRDRFDWGWMR